MPSTIGLRLLSVWNVRPDLIYVDASHAEEDVLLDLKGSLALRPRILCGDDYGVWDGVTRAVNKTLPDAWKGPYGFWWVDMQNRVSSAAIE
jgi:hypothetical protein